MQATRHFVVVAWIFVAMSFALAQEFGETRQIFPKMEKTLGRAYITRRSATGEEQFSRVSTKILEHYRPISSFDNGDRRTVRSRFFYKGLPVIGSEMALHYDSDGQLVDFQGFAIQVDHRLKTRPAASVQQAIALARSQLSDAKELLAVRKDLAILCTDNEHHLVWDLELVDGEKTRWRFLIDAMDGKTVHAAYDLIQHWSQGVTPLVEDGKPTEHQASFQFSTREDGRHRLVSEVAGTTVRTYNMKKSNNTGDGEEDDSANSAPWDDPVVATAHYYTEQVVQFYQEVFGCRSIDDKNHVLRSRVHYGDAYDNAFWDGEKMTYGDGSWDGIQGNFSALCVADVVCHELTHGLTEKSSGLIYFGESGAINESLSDIFASAFEFWLQRQNGVPYDWTQIGEQCIPEGSSLGRSALRYMDEPLKAGQPQQYRGDRWHTGADDQGGVHVNSGVGNRTFYLMSVGGEQNGYKIQGIGVLLAVKVFYYANVRYLLPFSDYRYLAQVCLRAAEKDVSDEDIEKYGTSGLTREQLLITVRNAWKATGVSTETIPEQDAETTLFRVLPAKIEGQDEDTGGEEIDEQPQQQDETPMSKVTREIGEANDTAISETFKKFAENENKMAETVDQFAADSEEATTTDKFGNDNDIVADDKFANDSDTMTTERHNSQTVPDNFSADGEDRERALFKPQKPIELRSSITIHEEIEHATSMQRSLYLEANQSYHFAATFSGKNIDLYLFDDKDSVIAESRKADKHEQIAVTISRTGKYTIVAYSSLGAGRVTLEMAPKNQAFSVTEREPINDANPEAKGETPRNNPPNKEKIRDFEREMEQAMAEEGYNPQVEDFKREMEGAIAEQEERSPVESESENDIVREFERKMEKVIVEFGLDKDPEPPQRDVPNPSAEVETHQDDTDFRQDDARFNQDDADQIIAQDQREQHFAENVTVPDRDHTAGNSHALIIANADYRNSLWESLETPLANARTLQKVLQRRYGFANTQILENASQQQIYEAFSSLLQTVRDQDQVLVCYFGHSYFSEEEKSSYWVPVDARQNRQKMVSSEAIRRFIVALSQKANHVLLVSASRIDSPFLVETTRVQADKSSFAKKSCQAIISQETVYLDETYQGTKLSPFAYFLTAKLVESDTAYVSASDLGHDLKRKLDQARTDKVRSGAMQFSPHQGGEFVFQQK